MKLKRVTQAPRAGYPTFDEYQEQRAAFLRSLALGTGLALAAGLGVAQAADAPAAKGACPPPDKGVGRLLGRIAAPTAPVPATTDTQTTATDKVEVMGEIPAPAPPPGDVEVMGKIRPPEPPTLEPRKPVKLKDAVVEPATPPDAGRPVRLEGDVMYPEPPPKPEALVPAPGLIKAPEPPETKPAEPVAVRGEPPPPVPPPPAGTPPPPLPPPPAQ